MTLKNMLGVIMKSYRISVNGHMAVNALTANKWQ